MGLLVVALLAALGSDALAQWVLARRDEIASAIEEVGLGYKLHCLAVRRG